MGKLEDKLFYRYCIFPVVLKCKQSGEIEETSVITNVNWLMNSGIYNFLLYNVLPICRGAQSNIGKPIVLTQYIANCVTYGFVSDLEPLVQYGPSLNSPKRHNHSAKNGFVDIDFIVGVVGVVVVVSMRVCLRRGPGD